MRSITSALLIVLLSGIKSYSFTNPWENGSFKGRIAYSADGNFNDEDDWAASSVALAIFKEFGVSDKLVHFDYNCILPKTNKSWEKEHETSIFGAIERFDYPNSIFYDCQTDLDGAVNSIARAINESSADNPLFYILAGPMEVPFLGIEKSDPEKRKYVYCISHNRWNDGYASADFVNHNKRDVIPTGVTWVQITDQNQFLSTGPFGRPSTEDEWRPWTWLRDSNKSNLNFLWNRLRVTTRADCSDAGMAYFLMTGDEQSEIKKLRTLLENGDTSGRLTFRNQIRLEAENFTNLWNFEVEYLDDRKASQRINLKMNSSSGGISTLLKEPYLATSGRYDIDVRYLDGDQGGINYSLWINGYPSGRWPSLVNEDGWVTNTISNVVISTDDEIEIQVESESKNEVKLDYVQLNRLEPFSIPEGTPLDDPEAQPGQIIVAGCQPSNLKYNGGGPAFLCGPDNPEDFLFRGELNPDGTRSGGKQEEIIAKLARSGANSFHCQMFRMQRCNIKQEGDDMHAPFIDYDPAKGLNKGVLNQWDRWLDLFEQHDIVVHLEFYNDATDVEMMGWTLDLEGNLHSDEREFFEGIVNKFKHHKNIMWGIEESCNKLPRNRAPHFKKLGELIASTDNFNHPIVQSFVIPEDPEGDFPGGGGTPDDYTGDPNIRVVTWLHVVPNGEDFEAQHQQYLQYYLRDSKNFIVMKNETFHHPKEGYQSRRYMWSSAMAGLQTLEAYHHADGSSDATLREDGLINKFMERTDFNQLIPRDDLAAGSTQWVLARPSQSYVAYTYVYKSGMGVKGIAAGTYDLLWFDTISGDEVIQTGIRVDWGDVTWRKPEVLGDEIALYIKRQG
ncbi:MAG: hypothetical protein O2887_05770 [Bacteroidetes bacterium]|nr:hypothetical protein [Bacteroidota bacterium]MDA1119989.1 hypothetical protein [Bacteroidota bacterium]